MKNICYFINSDWYFELHWKERALAVLHQGYEVHVVCNFKDQESELNLQSHGIKTYNSGMSEQSLNPFVILKDFVKSLRLLKRINPDVLHCITIKPCLTGGVYARIFNKKLVLSFVGLGRVFSSSKLKYSILKVFVTKLYKWIIGNEKSFLIFEHEQDKKDIIEITQIDEKRTIVINGAGINVNDFQFSQEPENSEPIVFFASRMIWSKGLADLIEAKKRLARKNVNFKLFVAGITVNEDPDAIPEKNINKWAEDGTIVWLGKCENIKELIHQCNVVALPSVYAEGVPRILIEAAAVGRAGLAYDSGGCSSIIENNITGYLVQKNNIQELTDKLEVLLSDDKMRTAFGKNARVRAIEFFCSSSVIARTLEIYQKLG